MSSPGDEHGRPASGHRQSPVQPAPAVLMDVPGAIPDPEVHAVHPRTSAGGAGTAASTTGNTNGTGGGTAAGAGTTSAPPLGHSEGGSSSSLSAAGALSAHEDHQSSASVSAAGVPHMRPLNIISNPAFSPAASPVAGARPSGGALHSSPLSIAAASPVTTAQPGPPPTPHGILHPPSPLGPLGSSEGKPHHHHKGVAFSQELQPGPGPSPFSAVAGTELPTPSVQSSAEGGGGSGPKPVLPKGKGRLPPTISMGKKSLDELRADTEIVTQSGHKVYGRQLTALTVGAKLYYQGERINVDPSYVKSVPKILSTSTFFLPANLHDQLIPTHQEELSGRLGPNTYARLYILWPEMLTRVPSWVRKHYHMVDDYTSHTMQVHWHMGALMSSLLMISGKLGPFKKQRMLVYESNAVLAPRAAFACWGSGATGEATDRPYILAIKYADSERELMNREDLAAAVVSRASSRNVSLKGTMQDGTWGMSMNMLPSKMLAELATMGDKVVNNVNQLHENAMRMFSDQVGNMFGSDSDGLASPGPWGPGLTSAGGPSSGKINFDDLPRIVLSTGRMEQIKALILINLLKNYLSNRKVYDDFERLAITRNDVELLLILQYKTHHELSPKALQFLVHSAWSIGRQLRPVGLFLKPPEGDGEGGDNINDLSMSLDPLTPTRAAMTSTSGVGLPVLRVSLADEIQVMLLNYIQNKRNPLSVTAAILSAIDTEFKRYDECRVYMRILNSRYQTLHIAILKQLGRFSMQARVLPLLSHILEPVQHSVSHRTINDTSPLQVAFELYDLEVMATHILGQYTRRQWQGEAYLSLTSCDDPRSSSLLSSWMGHKFLKDLGFAGGTTDIVLIIGAKLWHLCVIASNSFHHSPRGRWALHALCELAFLAIYQTIIFHPHDFFTGPLMIVFLAMAIGNVVDIMQHVVAKYGSPTKLKRFMADAWNTLNMITNIALIILTILLILEFYHPGHHLDESDAPVASSGDYSSGDSHDQGYNPNGRLGMAIAIMAVPVWVRSLGLIIPVYPSLGPLLATFSRMLEELFAFTIPLFALIAGFATIMCAVYGNLFSSLSTFPSALFSMVRSLLGEDSFNFYLEDDNGNQLPTDLYLYGIFVMLCFQIIAAIVFVNSLLIAIMTNRYRPSDMDAESQYKRAQIVEYYGLQVKHQHVCSPFNLIYWALAWMPSRPREKGSPSIFRAMGLPPLDGVVTIRDRCTKLKSGRGEISYFFFLLTLYPVMAALSALIFFLYTPAALWRFSTKNFLRLIKARRQRVGRVRPSDTGSPSFPTLVGGMPPSPSPATHPKASTEAARGSKEVRGSNDTRQVRGSAEGSKQPSSRPQPIAEGREVHIVNMHVPQSINQTHRLSPSRADPSGISMPGVQNSPPHFFSSSAGTRLGSNAQDTSPTSSSLSSEESGSEEAGDEMEEVAAAHVSSALAALAPTAPAALPPVLISSVGDSDRNSLPGSTNGHASSSRGGSSVYRGACSAGVSSTTKGTQGGSRRRRAGPVAEAVHENGSSTGGGTGGGGGGSGDGSGRSAGTGAGSAGSVPSPIKEQNSNSSEPGFMGGAVDKVKVQSAAIAGHLNHMLGTAGSHLDRIVSPLEQKAKEKLHLLYYLLWLATLSLFVTVGALLWVVIIGVTVITIWSCLYVWAAKVAWSGYCMLVMPIAQWWQEREERRDAQLKAREWRKQAELDKAKEEEARSMGREKLAAELHKRSQAGREAALKRWALLREKILAQRAHIPPVTYIEPKDLRRAILASNFRRLLTKWGVDMRVLMTRDELEQQVEDEDAANAQDDEDDNDDDNMRNDGYRALDNELSNAQVLEAVAALSDQVTQIQSHIGSIAAGVGQASRASTMARR